MLTNLFLKPDDNIALCCPASICMQPDYPQQTADYLKHHYALNSTFKHDTITGLPAAERAAIFLEYLFNPDIKLITALRGGEGSADTLPYIHPHYDKIKALTPKFILGFSDITALLVYFAKYYHWPVIHGPSPVQFIQNKVSKQSEAWTMDMLMGKSNTQQTMTLTPLNAAAQQAQIIEAELNGGCLSLIDISINDIWEIETKNKIIFFEDVGEKAHKIIRSLKYFTRIGLFDSAKAIILGDFTCDPIGCNQAEQARNHNYILKTLNHFASTQTIPVLKTEEFGHGKVNFPLMYSCLYRLELGEQPTCKRVVLNHEKTSSS